MRWISLFILIVLTGCVYVARQGTYAPSKTIVQEGTNRLFDVDLNPQP